MTIEAVQFFEDFSPIAFASRGFSVVHAHDENDAAEIELVESMERRGHADESTLSYGRQWPVRAGDVARAYHEELERVASLGRTIAARAVLYGSDESGAFEPRPFPGRPEQPRFSRSVNTMLRRAVELSGKDPNPYGPMIFHRGFWHTRLDQLLDLWLGGAAGEVAWLCSPFVRTASAALRERMSARTVVVPFRLRDLARLAPFIEETSAFLGSLPVPWDVPSYGRVGAFLESQREATGSIEGEALFLAGADGFRCPCFGIPMPQPEGGFPIRLRDGSTARLAEPPWLMAKIMGKS